ncbi:PREDICTED: uncharacterized protein LOC103342911 [Prunus mume]|uniref:Uncharacterized protein LOC103342911 n=1 Tax=Prunus mume TaxID=102107 RepID=A0ABM0PUS8_PRUMU|nr:PREDICTED: uncharacterized protein LOC103342911 [Prunus mume]
MASRFDHPPSPHHSFKICNSLLKAPALIGANHTSARFCSR